MKRLVLFTCVALLPLGLHAQSQTDPKARPPQPRPAQTARPTQTARPQAAPARPATVAPRPTPQPVGRGYIPQRGPQPVTSRPRPTAPVVTSNPPTPPRP